MANPSLETLLTSAHVVAIPTRTRFRGITVREAVIFDAPNGASEFSPFPEYADAEASRWLAAAVEYGWDQIPAALRTSIPVNATVPAVPADSVAHILDRFPGCTTAKVKVAERGQTLADDVARVAAVRAIMGDEARIRIDANCGWSVSEAFEAITQLAPYGLEYAEQPCASVPELVQLRKMLDGAVRIAADESVRKAEDPLAVARAGAADLLIVKAQPLGGIASALDIVGEAGLPVVISSALDTSVGISMGLHLAAALPEKLLAGACGLATVALLEGDVAADPLLPVSGELPVRRPEIDPEALERFRATPDREAWWLERVQRCFAML
ncbi:o-succinylbenzoate synthase [Leucobacter sp. 1207-22]|uniref:o-succinylbenzoate synthase n=1 Tax=Leucobacter sp. 1207-22 TaxID=2604456 RepID=UPI004062A19B